MSSPLYLFEKFEVGVIHLDARHNVVAMNDFARDILPVSEKMPFNSLVTSFHPPASAAKVSFLLKEASACPVGASSPMSMIINMPEQVLLIKLTRLADVDNATTGFVLVFYNVTNLVVAQTESPEAKGAEPTGKRQLIRIPVVANQRVSFVDIADVIFLESHGHYTRVKTAQGFQICNLSIGDLEDRLDAQRFMRVHRCFIVNLFAVAELRRDGTKTMLRMHDAQHPKVPVSRTAISRLRQQLGMRAG